MRLLAALVFLLASYQISAHDENLPDYIKPCDIRKSDFDSCVRQRMDEVLPKFASGIPELNVPSIDPVELHDIVIDQSNLKITFEDTKLHGLSDVQITEFSLKASGAAGLKITFRGNLSLTANYTAAGQILILPIQGHGPATIKANDAEVSFSTDIKNMTDKEGHPHLKLVKPTYKYEIGSTIFDLQNLFNGNKQLAETTLKFANENWKQLMDDLAPSAIKQIVVTIIKNINKLFWKIPATKMILGFTEAPTIL